MLKMKVADFQGKSVSSKPYLGIISTSYLHKGKQGNLSVFTCETFGSLLKDYYICGHKVSPYEDKWGNLSIAATLQLNLNVKQDNGELIPAYAFSNSKIIMQKELDRFSNKDGPDKEKMVKKKS